ncbi:ABC transporter ATP-binding protein [Paenibacillus sp. y28]|uniref:ABC transporter ATP-binding protein n=1 Tax=Paenibacillus sp. y28 TaxID=3129110 RepID=UPI00301AC655
MKFNGGTNPLRSEVPPLRKDSMKAMYAHLFSLVRSRWLLMAAAVASMSVISLLEFAIPQLTQYTIDQVIPQKQYSSLVWIGLGIIGVAGLLGLFNFISGYCMTWLGQSAIFTLRNDLFRHIQSLDMKFFDRNRTGDLMSRVTNDVNMLQQLVTSGMVQIVTELFTFLAIASYMLYVDWQMTLLLLCTLPVTYYVSRSFGKRMRSNFKAVQESVAEVSNHLQDSLSGIRLIKSFGNEEGSSEQFLTRSRKNMRASLKAFRLRSIFEPVVDLLNYLGMVIVLVFGAWKAIQGEFTVGAIAAFLAYLRLLQSPIRQFSRTMTLIQQSSAAYERISEILHTKPEITEHPDAVELSSVQGHLKFHGVDFAYQDDAPVLRNLDLDISPGKITALVGSSGAGKSTVTHLIARFYEPQAGHITLDGIDVRDISFASLRGNMGIVSQDVILLNGTIRENIAFGKPEATEAEIEAAARAANAHSFILQLPDSYDAQVGERGVKLSGGQKQRLSIARALLCSPRIIILDEATSALDTESEHLIQEALSALLTGRTCIVIAHRLSTIQKADRIVVMEQGTVLEQGTHEQLLAINGRYKQLHDLQFPQSGPSEASEPPQRQAAGVRHKPGAGRMMELT